ncbi:MAG: aldehyde dehydrogenase [Hyphomicrobiales bacterium]|nr:MAG: aldehyde dehydrogenase [Hyphomicrobiales bacterium]
MSWQDNHDRLYIGGQWVRSDADDVITVVSPATEKVFATVQSASVTDIDRAVAAARQAFDEGPWPRMTVSERLDVLRAFRDLYSAKREEIAQLVTNEMGCPISMSRAIQADTPRLILESYFEAAETYPFQEVRRTGTGTALITREPMGVVGAIVPWNVPQSVTMQKIAPALIAGCTVVLKPSPETPLDAYAMAELLAEAGLPDGVLSVVPADRVASERLVAHPLVDKIAFTGSSAVGRRIASICGKDLRRVTLELGGKSAAIFLDDADFESAVESLRLGSFRNSGQVCSLKTRLLVSESRETELLDRLVGLIGTMPVGDPSDEATQIGPMVSARHRANVEGYLKVGRDEARTVIGGGRPDDFDRGWYVEPTVFAGVDPNSRIAQEEIFGPVLTVTTYRDERDAVTIANNSSYGLNGAVFSLDVQRGLAVASQIRTGTVELNGNAAGFQAPMGGFKASGVGREQGADGLSSYLEPRAIGITPDVADLIEAGE